MKFNYNPIKFYDPLEKPFWGQFWAANLSNQNQFLLDLPRPIIRSISAILWSTFNEINLERKIDEV